MNIWQSYKQERDCFVHFFCILAVCWPSAQMRDTITILKNFTHGLSNKPFLIWLLTTPHTLNV